MQSHSIETSDNKNGEVNACKLKQIHLPGCGSINFTCLWYCKHKIDLERDECLERSNYSAEFRNEAIATRVKQMHGNLNRYIYLDVPEEFFTCLW